MKITETELLKYSLDFKDFEDWISELKQEEYYVKLENSREGYLVSSNRVNTNELGNKINALRFNFETAEKFAGEYGEIELVTKLDYFNIYRKQFSTRFEGLEIISEK